jgi:hypothetical protein
MLYRAELAVRRKYIKIHKYTIWVEFSVFNAKLCVHLVIVTI